LPGVIWVALSLFWLRFVEPAGLSPNFANGIAALLSIFILWKGLANEIACS
jgi:hypothetical protein